MVVPSVSTAAPVHPFASKSSTAAHAYFDSVLTPNLVSTKRMAIFLLFLEKLTFSLLFSSFHFVAMLSYYGSWTHRSVGDGVF
jgi:hypothetical protein